MPKDILIDMPAAKKPINSVRRLIREDPVNYIYESQFLINNLNVRKRDDFCFKKSSNIDNHPSIKKISSYRDNCSNKNFRFVLLNQLNQSII